VLGSLASYLFYHLLPVYGYKATVLACVIISLPITFVLANLFTKYVDVPSIIFSKQIGDFLLNKNLFQEKFSGWIPARLNAAGGFLKRAPLEDIVDEPGDG
jgi:hypothetical protein